MADTSGPDSMERPVTTAFRPDDGCLDAAGSVADPGRADPTAGRCRVEVINGIEGLGERRSVLDALARRSVEPNAFYEPFCLLPAVEAFGADKESCFVLVLAPAPGEQAIGFFPFERKRKFRGLPVSHLVSWTHPHLYLSAPLVDRTHGVAAWQALLAWARRDRHGALIEIPMFPGAGGAMQSLSEAVAGGPARLQIVNRFERALLERTAGDAETYMTRSSSTGARREWRRQMRRLSELGRLETRTIRSSDDATDWAESVLALENSGWKFRQGTAMQQCPNEAAFFRALCASAHREQRLHMLGLFLDDHPIALQCNLFAHTGAFALKVAYDERFAKHSPGTLLELENIRDMFGRQDFRWVDSCAKPDHPLLHRFWGERRLIEHVLIAPGGWTGQLLARLFPHLQTARRRLSRPVRGDGKLSGEGE